MNNKTTIDNSSNQALVTELEQVHWERYVDHADVKVRIKAGKLSIVYVEVSLKPL